MNVYKKHAKCARNQNLNMIYCGIKIASNVISQNIYSCDNTKSENVKSGCLQSE